MSHAWALKVSAGLMCVVAIGFGAPAPFVASQLLREGRLPIFMGMFPMYGGHLFGRCSNELFAVALGLLTAMSAFELFVGVLLWHGQQPRGFVALALLPLEIAFWFAFSLPIPPILGVVRIVLLWVGWSALR